MENTIGYFQIDNLIKGRIPFLFVTFGIDVKSHYGPLEKIHLTTWGIQADADNYITLIQERQIPKDFGIVVICQDGTVSNEAFNKLNQDGYTNTYWVEGGLTQMLKDKEAHS